MRLWKTESRDPEPTIRWFGKRGEADDHAADKRLPVYAVQFENAEALAAFLNEYEQTIRNEAK